MAFKAIRGLRMPYRRQGRIYFTLVNYDEMPETAKKRIDRLISDAAGGDRAYIEALRAWLLHDDADVRRVTEFGEALRRRYRQPVAAFGEMTAAGENAWSIQTAAFPEGERPLVNRVVLMEDLTDGESVREFEVWASLPRYHGQEICLYRGRTMGHKAICAFPTMRTARLRVKITSSDGPCRLRGFKAYYDE